MKKNALAYHPNFVTSKSNVYSYTIFGVYAPLLKMPKLVFFLNKFPGLNLQFGSDLPFDFDGKQSGDFPFYYCINSLENYSICLIANQTQKNANQTQEMLFPNFANYFSYWLIIEGEFNKERRMESLEEFGSKIAEVASFEKMSSTKLPYLKELFIDIDDHLFNLQRL